MLFFFDISHSKILYLKKGKKNNKTTLKWPVVSYFDVKKDGREYLFSVLL